MKFMLFSLSFLVCICSIQPCFALSDENYVRLLQESSKFREEKTALDDQLVSMKNSFNTDDWKKIFNEYREWIKQGIDQDANRNHSEGFTPEFSYAKAIHDYRAKLWAIEQNYKRTPQDISKGIKYSPEEYDDPGVSEYGNLGDNMGWVTKIIPVSGNLSQIHITDSFGNNHILYFFRKTLEERQNRNEDDSEYTNMEPQENNQIYVFDTIEEIPTPKTAIKLCEKQQTIKIIGKFSQSYN